MDYLQSVPVLNHKALFWSRCFPVKSNLACHDFELPVLYLCLPACLLTCLSATAPACLSAYLQYPPVSLYASYNVCMWIIKSLNCPCLPQLGPIPTRTSRETTIRSNHHHQPCMASRSPSQSSRSRTLSLPSW